MVVESSKRGLLPDAQAHVKGKPAKRIGTLTVRRSPPLPGHDPGGVAGSLSVISSGAMTTVGLILKRGKPRALAIARALVSQHPRDA